MKEINKNHYEKKDNYRILFINNFFYNW
jgi:hypothetical protein